MKSEQFVIWGKFHAACVRFWKENLEDNDEVTPYLKALEDVKKCKRNPFKAQEAEILDSKTKNCFVKRCENDLGLKHNF